MIIDGLKPGIYFGLAAELYHKDTALSRSDLVNLLDTPNSYWVNSWMNKNRPARIATDPMEYGEAFHTLLFEPEKFNRTYQILPIDEWVHDKKKIQYVDYMAMVESIKVLRAGANSNLFLSGGYPEVTIVFDEDGIRYRTRHDYFTPVCSPDFKTTISLNEEHLKRDFRKFGYDIQMERYLTSRRRFREQFAAGEAHVYGKVEREFMEKFMRSDIDEFMFIFQRKTKPYPFEPLVPEDDTYDSGADKVRKAVAIYRRHMKEFGPHKEWPVCNGKLKSFSMYYGIREGH